MEKVLLNLSLIFILPGICEELIVSGRGKS